MYNLVTVHKILHGFYGLNKRDFFMVRPSRTRGGGHKLSLSTTKTSIRHTFFLLIEQVWFI